GDQILQLLTETAKQQPQFDDRDDGHANESAQHGTRAALDAGAADQYRGNGDVVVARTELHVARTVTCGEQDAGNRRASAGDDIGICDGACRPDACGRGSAEVAADHSHLAANPRVGQNDLADDHGCEEVQRLDRYTGDATFEHLQAFARGIDALAAGDQRRATDQQRKPGDADQDWIGADRTDQE